MEARGVAHPPAAGSTSLRSVNFLPARLAGGMSGEVRAKKVEEAKDDRREVA